MCLAVPMKVVEIEGPVAQVEEGGVRRECRRSARSAAAASRSYG